MRHGSYVPGVTVNEIHNAEVATVVGTTTVASVTTGATSVAAGSTTTGASSVTLAGATSVAVGVFGLVADRFAYPGATAGATLLTGGASATAVTLPATAEVYP